MKLRTFQYLVLVLSVLATSGCNKKTSAAGSIFDGVIAISDDFTRSDGALGSSWNGVFSSGSIAVVSNAARITNTSSFSFQYATYNTPVSASAYLLSASFKINGATLQNNSGMALLANMDTNSVNTVTKYIICGFYGTNQRLYLTASDGSSQLGSTTFSFASGTSYNISLANDGANQLTCTATSSTQTESISVTTSGPIVGDYHGFGGGDLNASATIDVDDFLMINLD